MFYLAGKQFSSCSIAADPADGCLPAMTAVTAPYSQWKEPSKYSHHLSACLLSKSTVVTQNSVSCSVVGVPPVVLPVGSSGTRIILAACQRDQECNTIYISKRWTELQLMLFHSHIWSPNPEKKLAMLSSPVTYSSGTSNRWTSFQWGLKLFYLKEPLRPHNRCFLNVIVYCWLHFIF